MERRARAGLREAKTALRSAQSSLNGAHSDLEGAREEREEAESAAVAAESQLPDAQAQLATAQADLDYETREVERQEALVKEGLVARRDFQRQQAQVQSARSRVKQAQARIAQVQAEARGARSRVRRAEAAIRSAEAREQGAQSAIEGAGARIEGATADIATAQARVRQQRSEVVGAGADVSGAGARIRQMQQEARAAQAEIASAEARVRQAQSDLMAHHAHVRQQKAAANAARGRIGQAQAGVSQAQANVAQTTTTAGYTEIRSLLDGVVTQRMVSPGTLVNPGQSILKIAQINPIRLQANVAEADLKELRVGSPVTVRDKEAKGKPLMARLTSVAPAVDPQTRTGIVEAIVTNTNARFRPGEYVVMEIATGQSSAPLSVPAEAVQQRAAVATGEPPSSFVWVAEAASGGQWAVHPVTVQTGVGNGAQVEIRAGLKPGQRVVTAGYQYLSDGGMVTTDQSTLVAGGETALTPGPSPNVGRGVPSLRGGVRAQPSTQSAAIAVTDKGFEPASVTLRGGAPIKLTFTRKTEATCATEVVLPEPNIKRKLPLNQPVTIEFTPKKSGVLNYACGMNMLKGQLVVR